MQINTIKGEELNTKKLKNLATVERERERERESYSFIKRGIILLNAGILINKNETKFNIYKDRTILKVI